jgi:hypothetical protein
MKVPQGLGQKILIPPDEIGVTGYRPRPWESDVQVLSIEMVQIEICWRRVLKVREPFVDKEPQVVGGRRCETAFWLEALHTRLVIDEGISLSGHYPGFLSMFGL